jgi:hypothetical protein
MKKVEEYRWHADECRGMANRTRSPRERDMLINMAATWDSLAVDRQRRVFNIENGAASIPIDRLNASNDE